MLVLGVSPTITWVRCSGVRKNDLVAAEAAFRAAIAADSSYVDARRNLEVLEMLSEKQLVGVLIGDKLAVEMRQ